MEKEEAIGIMIHLAGKLENSPALEDLVSAFAEFLAHSHSQLCEQDFAFLATIGAMIYLKGFRQYDSSLETEQLMQKLRETGMATLPNRQNVASIQGL